MNIKVIDEHGAVETITLSDGPNVCSEGTHLNMVQSGGMDHYFTKDGFYDGWGAGVEATPQQAQRLVEAIEESRRGTGN